MAAHSEEFVSRGKKYQTNFSPQFHRTREETAEQTAARGSLLSSFLKCVAGLSGPLIFGQASWVLVTNDVKEVKFIIPF